MWRRSRASYPPRLRAPPWFMMPAPSAEQPRIARRGGAGPKRPQLQTLVYAQKLVKFSNLATLDSYYVHLCPN